MQYGVFVSQVLEGREQLSPILAVAGKRGKGEKRRKQTKEVKPFVKETSTKEPTGFW